ncbi:MAG: NTP transferase domain-containing protein [Oscillospiraceae bacterium]|nr:NTP transferase domain-containing protein [Oscillospiraceae bacterium]
MLNLQEPCLVILAAGMGSRFGGLKQITAVDNGGHAIIDFSLYDAYRAGFRKVVFVIKHAIEADFRAAVADRMAEYFDVRLAFQELDKLPEGFTVPEGRVKPWGTAHAVLCAADLIDGPFAVINADDFYGPEAYEALYQFMTGARQQNEHAMVAYELRKTVTENGSVARGICSVENSFLSDVVERTRIEKRGADAAYTEDGETWFPLSGALPVSMNCWAFGHEMLHEFRDRFPAWLKENLAVNPEKCEYFLPFVVNSMIQEGKGRIRVLNCRETWYGITYREDLQSVIRAIADMRSRGIYPEALLERKE